MNKKSYDNKMDYEGEIGIILVNQSNKLVKIVDGDRIAQLVFAKCEHIEWDQLIAQMGIQKEEQVDLAAQVNNYD